MKNNKNYVLISLLIFFLTCFTGCKDKSKEVSPQNEIVSPRKGDITVKVLATGTIEPYSRIEIKASDRGRMEKIYFDEGDTILKGQTLALISTIDRITLVDTARANLYQTEKSGDQKAIESAKEDLAIAEKAYNPVPIIAPVSGEIIKRSVEIGVYISMENILFVISDRLILRIQVDEADIGKIKKYQVVKFYLDTFPDEINNARVQRISKEGKLTQNVMQYEVLAFPDKVLNKWISGMTINAEFIISELKDVLLLPADAVRKTRDKTFVAVMSNNKRFLKKVETGISDYKDIQIISGVTEKDRVLILSQKDFSDLSRSLRDRRSGGDKMRDMGRMIR